MKQARTVLVTGTSRGIGRATALRLARQGDRVVAHYGSAEADAAALLDAAAGADHPPYLLKADLADAAAVAALAQEVRGYATDGLDAIVHNAGIVVRKPFVETTAADLDRLYAVNVRAPFLLTQLLSEILNPGASILFVSTVATRHQIDGLSAYAMTKAAIEAFARQIANDFGARDIRVNVVAPGAIDTDMSPALRQPGPQGNVLARQALKRVGQPADVADAIAMMLSPDARWITGAIVPVSGGTKL